MIRRRDRAAAPPTAAVIGMIGAAATLLLAACNHASPPPAHPTAAAIEPVPATAPGDDAKPQLADKEAVGIYKVCVRPDGTVRDVWPIKLVGNLQDPGIMSTLRTWTFHPAPVEFCSVIRLVFSAAHPPIGPASPPRATFTP